VFKAADSREEYTGMGTTVVAALCSENMLTIGSAGDSRCYLFRNGELSRLTTDDSWVSAAWAEGILSSEEIERHPLRNVITKAVGAKESLEISVVEHQFQSGDIAMLCSDGLHGMINDKQIREVLASSSDSLEQATTRLVGAANEAGGKDNVTVLLLRYTD
jgi:serine/threonine protein phosphatase PrpC